MISLDVSEITNHGGQIQEKYARESNRLLLCTRPGVFMVLGVRWDTRISNVSAVASQCFSNPVAQSFP